MIDEPFEEKIFGSRVCAFLSAMLGKLVRLAEALLTFVPALRTILFIAFPVTPQFA